jgi:hypothetical protein
MKNPAKLVALLEKSYSQAKQGATQDMRATLIAGLNWETNYWVDCALQWIEDGAELDEGIIEVLETISSNTHFPQATRHKALKSAKGWLRAKNT